MPQWLLTALLTLGGTVILVAGTVVGAVLSSRAQSQAARVQADAAHTTAENALIDQLQEELKAHRDAQEVRQLELDRRLTHLEQRNGILTERNDLYRDLLHKHRAHIWDGKPPPPPDWPDDLPR